MNETITIKITADVSKLKAGCQEAAKAIQGIDDKGKTAGDNSEKHFGKMGNAAKKAGAVMAKGLAAGISAAATGIVALTKAAVQGYAEYEQLIGGVETLFKDSAGIVQNYANEAYKTAGLSANAYMETITGFSASMLQALEGDTKAAAEASNNAVIDMADNANKMGTSMESIQNAYQGFAKQNYTMLDNLKLGYGGTKKEMERLLVDAEKISGIEYDISNFADVTAAIHVIQTELGITGTTSLEAASTISGSTAMMKASWDNLVVGIADDNADFDALISNFVDSASTALSNLLPRIQTALTGIATLIQELVPIILELIPPLLTDFVPKILTAAVQVVQALIEGIVAAFPELINVIATLLPQIITMLAELIPQITGALLGALPVLIETILQAAAQILTALGEILPVILEQIVSILPQIITTIVENIPVLLEAAVSLLMAIVEAIPVIIPMLLEALPQIITGILNAVLTAIPLLLQGAIQLFMAIIKAIPTIITSLGKALPEIIETILTAVANAIPLLLEGATDLLTAIIEAIPIILPVLIEALPEIITSILEAVMNAIPLLLGAAVDLLMTIVYAVPMMIPDLLKALPQIIQSIINALVSYAPRLLRQGIDLFMMIVNSITTVIPKLVAKFQEIVKTIKDKLVGAAKNAMKFDWSLPKLKLPHFSISGKFSLDPPSIPKIKVDWYAQGGVFDTPTLFPYGDGQVGGLGEAGAEAIVPLENNTKWLDRIAERLQGGQQPIYLNVDGKTFAEISIDSINQLTKQRGSLPLVLA